MKVKIARSDPTLINMLDCQIQISVAFLMRNKDGGEIVVFLMQLKKISNSSCHDLVTFRGRFYAVFLNGNMFVIDRYSLEVNDLGDRVFFIGRLGNIWCSAKELPDGCGVSGNSILFTNGPENVTLFYIYGEHTGNAEDDLNILRSTRATRVIILNKSPPVVALQVEG
ncbi:unnamed protein product [Arabidopsis lyrata]|uniref:Uncharacterized protein n=1 Tax=Arabidopsis lyrata subsp. lyrata TaxID=81972 RepID=D7LCR7_ARALL|nr:hypothetical protein ARALYDRAFT_901327 [Arabidopsis lyrata subsp. lyrata]CAH8263650.1 unnamed protein product [Arabidopsis lyrata]